jgi:hemerythrin-like domain-containing protein
MVVPHFNLFSSHKFLEQSGALLLAKLATVDAQNEKMIDDIYLSLSEFLERLQEHANWEEHFVFKLLPQKTIIHKYLNDEITLILQELRMLECLSNWELHKTYLHFRKLYSDLLSHLYNEEANIIKMLSDRFSEEELKQIDNDIYKSRKAKGLASVINYLYLSLSL